MDLLKKAVTSFKDRVVKSPLERSILEACSDENWGASNTTLHEIAEKTFNHEERLVIMKTVWELIKSPNKEWRRLYKVLNLLENLLKFGSAACLHEIQDEAFKIRMLQDFSFREGSDERGIGVRDKAKYISTLLSDRKLLEEERDKANKTWSKFSGISSESTNQRYNEPSWRNNSYDPYVARDKKSEPEITRGYSGYENPEHEYRRESKEKERDVKDIFAAPEVNTVKTEHKQTIWDSEPGRLPQAPRVIKPPPQFTAVGTPSIFEVPNIITAEPAPVGRSPNVLGESLFNPPNVAKFPAPGYSKPAPNFPQPTPVFPQPEPAFTQPVPSFTQPAPSFTQPAPSFPQAIPSFTQPAASFPQALPSFTQPIPSFPQPFPSLTQPALNFPQPAPSFTQASPSLPQSTPNYSQLGHTLPPAQPNPGYQSSLSGLSFPPAPGYSNPGLVGSGAYGADMSGLMIGDFSKPSSGAGPAQTASYEAQKNTGKLRFNIGDNSGATMEQMKVYGRGGFSDFQAAPVQAKEPVDLESKLINLDDLLSGQPKPKENSKPRW